LIRAREDREKQFPDLSNHVPGEKNDNGWGSSTPLDELEDLALVETRKGIKRKDGRWRNQQLTSCEIGERRPGWRGGMRGIKARGGVRSIGGGGKKGAPYRRTMSAPEAGGNHMRS